MFETEEINQQEQETEPKHKEEPAMKIGTMKESKYIKKEDVGNGKNVTIKRLEQQDVSMENEPEELKWTMYFNEFDKGMVLNWTNIQLIAKALDTDETDEWVGKNVQLYDDPNVSFGGKLTGGIRVRAAIKAGESEDPAAGM